jgi:hypothetical protein
VRLGFCGEPGGDGEPFGESQPLRRSPRMLAELDLCRFVVAVDADVCLDAPGRRILAALRGVPNRGWSCLSQQPEMTIAPCDWLACGRA